MYSPVVRPCAHASSAATRAVGPLAVRPGDVDRRVRQLRIVQQRRQRAGSATGRGSCGSRGVPRARRGLRGSSSRASAAQLGELRRRSPRAAASSSACFSRSAATTSSAAFARNPSFASLAVDAPAAWPTSSRCLRQPAPARPRRRTGRAAGGRTPSVERQRDPSGGLRRRPRTTIANGVTPAQPLDALGQRPDGALPPTGDPGHRLELDRRRDAVLASGTGAPR